MGSNKYSQRWIIEVKRTNNAALYCTILILRYINHLFNDSVNYDSRKNFFLQMPCTSSITYRFVYITEYNGICMINSLSLSLIARTHYESIMHPRRVCIRVKCVKYSAKLMAKFKSPGAFCRRSKWKIKDTRISPRDSVCRT